MSDSFDFTEIYNYKFKKAKFILPLTYLKDILNGMKKLFFRENILLEMKNSPLSLYNRLFGSDSRRHIFNVLVLIADLESNVGAVCVELLNSESSENLKNFNYRQHFSYNDDIFFDDSYYNFFDTQISNNESIYDDSSIDNITDTIKEESKILEINLYSEENMDNHINPDYLMQVNLSVDNPIPLFDEVHQSKNNLENATKCEETLNSDNVTELKAWDWNSFDTASFTEASTSANSCEEFLDKENDISDCESDYSNDNFNKKLSDSNIKSLPKPIRREIYQLKMLGVPYDYYDITQSSHEVFKTMKSKPDLTKIQLSAMTNARRRYINRRAATRCRTQKLQQKDQLKLELKKLQNQLMQTKITLTKAYQQRNEMRDQYRIVQRDLVFRLQGPDEKALNAKRWSTELKDNKSLVLIENIHSS